MDPTTEFRRISCCDAPLGKKVFHYACQRCGMPEWLLFLFDERIFFANARSLPLELVGSNFSEGFVELGRALNEFVVSVRPEFPMIGAEEDPFVMERYRQAILELLISSTVRFSAINFLSLFKVSAGNSKRCASRVPFLSR